MWLDRLNAWLLAALLALAPIAANASQNQLSSPTTGTVSGLQLTNNYNNALDSLNTCNAGASAPSNQLSGAPSLGNCWLNSTSGPYPWQSFDGANWVTPFWIDPTNHVTNVKIGGGVATVASASTVDLCGAGVAPRAYITISGSVPISAFGSTCSAGHVKIVTFTGATTLVNGSGITIPGAANVQVSAGDQAILVALGSGNWQVLSYAPANGQALVNPAVDVGSYVMSSAVSVPSSKYLLAYGQAVSRATYATLLSAVTISQTVSSTNGSPTLTGFSDTTQIPIFAPLEGSAIPPGSYIQSCTSTTCTMNNNASASTSLAVTIFPYGNGCGWGSPCGSTSTTFNLPDCRAVTFAGRANMGGTARSDLFAMTSTYFGASPASLGAFGGGQSQTLATSNLPPYTPSGSVGVSVSVGAITGTVPVQGAYPGTTLGGVVAVGTNNGSPVTAPLTINTPSATGSGTFTGSAQGGSSTPFSRIQPTITANCLLRVLAMNDAPALPRSLASNDHGPMAADRRRAAA